MNEKNGVNESEFFMWRTLFAVAHVDGIVSAGEVRLMSEIMTDYDFTEKQIQILKRDIADAQDAEEMFRGVTEPEHQKQFFEVARDMVWRDGDFGSEEQEILARLQSIHLENMAEDVAVLEKTITFELEDD